MKLAKLSMLFTAVAAVAIGQPAFAQSQSLTFRSFNTPSDSVNTEGLAVAAWVQASSSSSNTNNYYTNNSSNSNSAAYGGTPAPAPTPAAAPVDNTSVTVVPVVIPITVTTPPVAVAPPPAPTPSPAPTPVTTFTPPPSVHPDSCWDCMTNSGGLPVYVNDSNGNMGWYDPGTASQNFGVVAATPPAPAPHWDSGPAAAPAPASTDWW